MANKAGSGTDLLAYVIDGMIQGVSQQSAWQRRDTQCEAQFDCINSPVNGCEARPGFDYLATPDTADHSASFQYEIFRGDSEHYLVVIDPAASGAHNRKLHVFDLITGLECAVTLVASQKVTITIASPGIITWVGHQLVANQPVYFEDGDDVLPTGLVAGTTYYVLASGLTADTFKLGATAGGAAINTTGSQSGDHLMFARVTGARAASEAYLTCVKDPSLSIMAATLEDYTFIGNREVITAMSSTNLSPAKKNEGIMFVKAGGYLLTYQAAITYNGKVYTWQYTTPDNSTVANAAYISTNQIAAAFFRSFTGVDAVVTPSGTTVAGVSVATITIASPGVVTWNAHGFPVGQPVYFTTTGALPTGLLPNVQYYVLAAGLTTNAFELGLTPGGSAINTSGTQSGVHTGNAGLYKGSAEGVGAAGTGNVGGVPGAVTTGSITLTSLGFTVAINGNCIKIGRADSADWDIDTGDGVGNTYLLCGKDTIQSFNDLPASCFSGFTIKVIGTNQQQDDDYYVEFKGADGSSGYWQEVVAPGTPLTFDPTTMPQALVNTGVGTFDFGVPPWGNRVSGDGIYTALDPSFIGSPLQEMAFDHSRLALMPEGSCVWSRTKNKFVFFPDSAQTVLDTDPIDIKPGGGKTIALLRRIIQIAETTFLWAEKIQFRATSGVNPFTGATVEAPPSTNYEFSPLATPKAVGQSLYFATEVGKYATIRDLSIQNNLPVGATDVTAHVKKYIPKGVRWITASDTLGFMFNTTVGDPTRLYCYNYLLSATARLQSAWNAWRLPAGCIVLWAGMDVNYLYVYAQRTAGAVLLRADLSPDLVDDDDDAEYRTRLDMRVTEAQCTTSYNSTTKRTTITLPYAATEAVGWADPTICPLMVVNRDGTGPHPRGYTWPIVSFPTPTTILVTGDCTGSHWYAGFRVRSERTLSRFYVKTTKGLLPTEFITVKNLVVNFSNSGYFRGEVSYVDGGDTVMQPMTGRIFGDPTNVLGTSPLATGSFKIGVDALNDKHTITLVNDSYLPSSWNSMVYQYGAAFIAKPTEFGQSVPSYFNQGGTAGYANNF